MAKKKQESQSQGNIIEEPEIIVDKAEEFFQDKKKKNFTFIFGGILIVAVVGWFLYRGQIDSKNTEANEEMFQAMYFYEADSLNKALNGDGLNYGFLQIINDYSGTEAANLANLYTGSIYMNLSDFNSAIRYLSDFSASDYLMQARAYALIGDCHMELSQFEEAVNFYEKAVEYKPNESFTPVYLQKLAIARENAGQYAEAAEAYDEIITEYVRHRLVQESKKQKARLEALAN